VDDLNRTSPESSTRQEPADLTNGKLPERISRHVVKKVLGKGGFGVVYLAYDGQLHRDVAIKVPHPALVTRAEDAEPYLAEARAVASLRHPNIVTVYDVGGTPEFPFFVVLEVVEGSDLKRRLKEARPSVLEAVELIATVAETLHFAHRQGLVHRDIKPSNILLDKSGKPYVADFGLALKEENVGTGPRFAGTPVYMSPEQARGEGHRVDGRSDIFSLGIVLYEMLAGRRPFTGQTRDEILDQITTLEVRPLRQWDDSIPKELDRICLKALAKRAADRYPTARDLAEDLRSFLEQSTEKERSVLRSSVPPAGIHSPSVTATPLPSPLSTPGSSAEPLKIVPKGLRSFDAHDADFFLELLPGPRDRVGLPDSIRFWKTRIEELDAENTFAVGLIYGPSGCGKSSLVKAGLLPRLAENVIALYVEATAEETETRILNGLRKRCPTLPSDMGLKERIAALRRGQGVSSRKKVLIVLDQFEQWLQSHPAIENAELVQALRHCDGGLVQCIVMVRDDFWMAATRFFREMEVRLVEAQNSAVVDLFDLRHARKVLALFGEAGSALPKRPAERTDEQNAFLDQAVAGLAQDEKVICVRLAVFAEMVKGKSWSPELLRKWGGAVGVGATFLEETFSAATAHPEHRYHQRAARLVLKALLPDAGGDIKGQMRSYLELQTISGYSKNPRDFDDLLRTLDSELRLITPTESDGREGAEGYSSTAEQKQKYYQLTHDYLVHSLRDWLTRKQRETWRGRAELRLQELTAQWTASQRQRQFLPTLPESLVLSIGVPGRRSSPESRALLRSAAIHHAINWGFILLVMFVAGMMIQAMLRRKNLEIAENEVDRLVNAAPSDVPIAIERIEASRNLALPLLQRRFRESEDGSSEKLHAAFALASVGQVEEEFLLQRLPTLLPSEARNMMTALALARPTVEPKLLQQVKNERNPETRSRLAIVLLDMENWDGALEVLALGPDPASRTAFIQGFGAWHGRLGTLPGLLLSGSDNPAFQSGICAALGLMDKGTLAADERDAFTGALEHLYREAPDGGVHCAAGWALRQWGRKLPDAAPRDNDRPRNWFVNTHGMTFVKVQPGIFMMGGDPDSDKGKRHEVTLTRPFFMCDREVSLTLFLNFVKDENYAGEKASGWKEPQNTRGDIPVTLVSWENAVLFCNWLNWTENRADCYKREKGGKGWTCDFEVNGYRLPTEAEWEYACRAATTTLYSFGDDPKHFLNYEYLNLNADGHSWPGASKLPNGWGLFDMHGNVAEWCWDWSGGPYENCTDPHGPPSGKHRSFRGGHFLLGAEIARSGRVDRFLPTRGFPALGFRILYSEAKGS
jgi:serine/threonine protein kinase/formylglycine-generating enzyme required for sulfatase activity